MKKTCKGCYAADTDCHPSFGEAHGCILGYQTDGYEDRRGWQYKVMQNLAGKYAPRYHKPESAPDVGWKTCKAFTHRDSLEDAERDLKAWAAKKGMTVVENVK